MTALCTHRRALKTAPIEFSESTTEKDCHCIRNNGEWRCSRPIGVNFSKHITRSHGRSSNPNSTQSAQRRKVHREKLWAQRPRASQLLLLRRAPSRRLRAPWATRTFPPGCAKCCASKNRTLEIDPSQLPSRLPSNLRAGRASPSRLRVKGCGTPRTDPKRVYPLYRRSKAHP